MPLLAFDNLHKSADSACPRVPLAVAAAADRTVLEAVAAAARRGWIRPILTGRESDIRETAAHGQIDVSDIPVIDTPDPAFVAVAQVRERRAQFLMKGQIDTLDRVVARGRRDACPTINAPARRAFTPP
jgi:phosphotransacetylase